ncbi:GNAT family N-acetyltransferase [Prevotella sp. 10(H)]|uniref:GNAT family N-acetyltransferase n=1 Tax=Prevotella sp. 10(H) TaxID=1158294 RepID=UPI0004A74D2D|nr:GNAT family N-acetyltransferase [Prevotella sp. 10(H)]
MEYKVIHNEDKSCFEAEVEGMVSVVDYTKRENVLVVTHTGVPPQLEGRGIAAAMTKTMLDYARDKGYKVRPVCSYTRTYILRHPEYQDIVAD